MALDYFKSYALWMGKVDRATSARIEDYSVMLRGLEAVGRPITPQMVEVFATQALESYATDMALVR
jgi:hypothetical protein